MSADITNDLMMEMFFNLYFLLQQLDLTRKMFLKHKNERMKIFSLKIAEIRE